MNGLLWKPLLDVSNGANADNRKAVLEALTWGPAVVAGSAGGSSCL